MHSHQEGTDNLNDHYQVHPNDHYQITGCGFLEHGLQDNIEGWSYNVTSQATFSLQW